MASPLPSKRKGDSVTSGPAAQWWRLEKESKNPEQRWGFKGRSQDLLLGKKEITGKSEEQREEM